MVPKSIAEELLAAPEYAADEVPICNGIGLYGLVLRDHAALAEINVEKHNILYIGMTESTLMGRNHFLHLDSSFSTLRRSLGALLKTELKLLAIPRGAGRTAGM
jgi:hypothetical protein